ncbi:NAD(P)-binding Rossmann-fold superfamily protein [Actinidia rufa]|uniref:NAD(P)-binding Rossmann-fold superfamily protein n=1 Tax=Actinidia rufa TaxID=165716 RepID=A0A7J0F0H9_9ERIC|nr:NAD(P)-binding Rossmann-fold superfamily protein [Actinidia rufa]
MSRKFWHRVKDKSWAALRASAKSPPVLLGKVALVTGGATGIGESIVRLFLEHGAKVCVVDIQDNLGQHLCETLGGEPNTCFFHCDVTIEDNVRRAVDFAVEKFGTLDIMVNNAGLGGSPSPDILLQVPLGAWVHMHTLGPSTLFWDSPRMLQLRLGKYGIRVNCVSPYAVATSLAVAHLPEEERTEDALVGFRDFVGRNANLQGVELTAADVANSVLFLASDEARYISGANLMVDGGFTSTNHSLRVFR